MITSLQISSLLIHEELQVFTSRLQLKLSQTLPASLPKRIDCCTYFEAPKFEPSSFHEYSLQKQCLPQRSRDNSGHLLDELPYTKDSQSNEPKPQQVAGPIDSLTNLSLKQIWVG